MKYSLVCRLASLGGASLRFSAVQCERYWSCPDKVESGFLEFAKEHIHDREDQEWHQGRALGSGIAFDAVGWQKLRDNEINAAAREQMGLNRSAIQTQLFVSEGKVLGHIETSLGRHAVIDRGVNVVAVREISGSELKIGQILSAGFSR